jgi:mono/diheme cytochrome c family protein
VSLKVADSLPAGKTIKCPKCGNGFRLSFVEEAPVAPKRAESRLPRRVPRPPEPAEEENFEDEEEVEERPRARPRKKKLRKKQEPASNTALIVGLALGGALLVGVVVGLAVLWLRSPKQEDTLAQNTPKQSGGVDGSDARGGEPGPRMGRRPRGEGAEGEFDPSQRGDRRMGGPGGGGDAAGGDAVASAGVSPQFAAGKSVFDQSCARCHSDGAGGGGAGGRGGRSRGPNLSTVGRSSSHTVDWFMKFVRDPHSLKPDARMPAFPASRIPDTELRALAQYLTSLK